MKYHLAQINVAKARAEMTEPLMQGFVSRLAEINSIADNAPGFVWRLQSEAGDSTAIRIFGDQLILVNMSVWESFEDLKNYVYKSKHVELVRDRQAWFSSYSGANQALWWVEAGHIPSFAEAKEKLAYLEKHGPGPEAFVFGKNFPAPK